MQVDELRLAPVAYPMPLIHRPPGHPWRVFHWGRHKVPILHLALWPRFGAAVSWRAATTLDMVSTAAALALLITAIAF
jgi:hypothetical protein